MFIGLIKILLFFWIISIVSKWYRRYYLNRRNTPPTEHKEYESGVGKNYTGPVQDADFEEL